VPDFKNVFALFLFTGCRRYRRCRRFLTLCRGEVVQVVCGIVAHAAFRELLEHFGWMLLVMALVTSGLRLMLVFVAIDTIDVFVLGFRCRELSHCSLVACTAVFVGRGGTVLDLFRHVSLVTVLAALLGHIGSVRLMALYAIRNLAMDIVAVRACPCSMPAWEVLQLLDLFLVARQTRIGKLSLENDIKRCMRILMAI